MKKYKEDYGRYTRFEPPTIEECTFGDPEDVYASLKDKYPETNVSQMWNNLEVFLKSEIEDVHQKNNVDIVSPLKEVFRWAEKRDAYSVALLLCLFWEHIEGLFTDERCAGETVDFVHYLRFSIE